MSGPNTRMWTGTSSRYLTGGGEWEEVPVGLRDSGLGLSGPEAASLTPTWACTPGAHQVTFSEESLPKGHGDFILGYYSHTHSILIGVTEPFQVSRPDCTVGGAIRPYSHATSSTFYSVTSYK